MKKSTVFGMLLLVSIFIFVSCTPSTTSQSTDSFKYKQINALSVPSNFSYRTSELVTINYEFGTQYSGVSVSVAATTHTQDSEGEAPQDLFAVGSGIIGKNGWLSIALSIPTSYTHVVLQTQYIGLPRRTYAKIEHNMVGTPPQQMVQSRAIQLEESKEYPPTRVITPTQRKENNFWYIDSYNRLGVPTNITSVSIAKQLLDDINVSLPEEKPVPEHNPQYLEDGKSSTLQIIEHANVWVTFVHEGAGYLNALGFYTYITADGPPQSKDDLDIYIIFPNASYPGGGGNLRTGDTLYIGEFDEGTSIGWVLVADGWTGNNGYVREHRGIYFSDADLNPESTPDKRIHTVVLYDDDEDIFIVGFEDLNRDGRTDDDFNDLVFFAMVDPIEAVGNVSQFTEIKRAIDTDGDGVIDSEDAFPLDPRYATYEEHRGTLAYEDMWPKLGDYDFNDLVVQYHYGIYGNADGLIPRIDFTYTPVASGAGYQNGLALFLPFAEDTMELDSETIPEEWGFDTIDHEEGTTIVIFKSAQRVVSTSRMYNTELVDKDTEEPIPHVEPKDVSFTIHFYEPVSRNKLGVLPFDVFMLANTTNYDNHEIHLPDVAPTPLLPSGLLGTENDNSDRAENRYYKTRNNLPWALHIPGAWIHPLERVSIVDAYKAFGAWAESGGTLHKDWYSNPLHRDESKLYIR